MLGIKGKSIKEKDINGNNIKEKSIKWNNTEERIVEKSINGITKCIRFISIILCMIMLVNNVTVVRAANYVGEYQINLTLHVGDETYTIKAVDLFYDENTSVSLRDFANAVSGTATAFNVRISDSAIAFTNGQNYEVKGGENIPFSQMVRSSSSPEYVQKRNSFTVNGMNNHYFTMIYETYPDVYDAFIFLPDLALLLGKNMWYENGEIYIDPDSPLELDPRRLEDQGYFMATRSVLVGDATNGEVYYSFNGDVSVAMASTTKLMTYTLVMDAVSRGELSLEDMVVISENAERLSNAVDGNIRLTAGDTASISDLLYAMLLPSSNECSLVLAEAVAGSEKRFVQMMNEKAAFLGMSDGTIFYNCNGLPAYTAEVFEGKVQNHITAKDMFKLACYILAVYPQVTEITSSTYHYLPTMGRTVYNINSLLFNMSGTVGLKTGTTNQAGCCLVSALMVRKTDGDHYVVAIEMGGEDLNTRNGVSKTLLTYGKKVCLDGGVASIPDYVIDESTEIEGELVTPVTGEIPDNPEDLAQLIVWTARNYLEPLEPELIDVPEE